MLPFFMSDYNSLTNILNEIGAAVSSGDFDTAMSLYLIVFQSHGGYLSPPSGSELTKEQSTHIHNAANLARRAFFIASQHIGSTPRIKSAVKMLTGEEKKVFQSSDQQPSFFYIPNLPSTPFAKIESVKGLDKWVEQISKYNTDFSKCIANANERYVEVIGEVPNHKDWIALSNNWNSLHLMKGGHFTEYAEQLPDEVKRLFMSDLLAHCPSHAPEVVLSVLQPKTKIPPHFGISNIKWTLHIPLQVNNSCYLEVAGKREYWNESVDALLFDDSFVHGAENPSDVARAVLIIDIWNPFLEDCERSDIKELMSIYGDWSEIYGALAVLDKRFYK